MAKTKVAQTKLKAERIGVKVIEPEARAGSSIAEVILTFAKVTLRKVRKWPKKKLELFAAILKNCGPKPAAWLASHAA